MESSTERARPPFWWFRWVPLTLLVVGLAALLYLAATPLVVPVALSFALAFMLEPVTEWFERRGFSRAIAVLLTIAAATLATLAILILLVPAVWNQLVASAQKLPGVVKVVGQKLHDLLGYVESHVDPEAYRRVREGLDSVQSDPSSIVSSVNGFLLSGLVGLLSFGSSAVGLLIVPFFVYYLLLDLHKIRVGIDERIPLRHRDAASKLFDDIGNVLRGYVRGRVLVSIAMAVFYTLGLAVCGVPVPAAIGFIAGFVGIVPYLGVTTGILLAIGFAALDGAGLLQIVGIVVVFSVAQLLEDYVLTPRLIGDRLELHPLLVFIGLIVAGDLYGLLGLVMAIPVLAVLKVLIHFLDGLYRSSDFFLTESTKRSVATHALVAPIVQPPIAPQEPLPVAVVEQSEAAPTIAAPNQSRNPRRRRG